MSDDSDTVKGLTTIDVRFNVDGITELPLDLVGHSVAAGAWSFRAAQYTDSMRIPHTKLSSAVLRAIVEEFVTRDGTDHSSVERRIEMVLLQLHAGRAELHFDCETQTCNILPLEENPSSGGRDE